MAFIKLTKQDNGRCIYIARDTVVAVTLNTSGYHEKSDGTIVLTSTGVYYIVKETPESVIGLLMKGE